MLCVKVNTSHVDDVMDGPSYQTPRFILIMQSVINEECVNMNIDVSN